MENPKFEPVPQNFEPSLDFKGLFEKANAEFNPAEVGTDVPPPAIPTVTSGTPDGLPSVAEVAARQSAKTADADISKTPEVTRVEEEKPADPASTADAKLVEFRDTDLVRVKVDGKEEVVSFKEYKDGIQREAAFTKRMQTLARQREEAEQQLSQQYAQLYNYAQGLAIAKQELEQNNPLSKLAQQLESQKSVEQDPNTIATIGEIQTALKQHQQEMDARFQRERAEQQATLVSAAQQLRAQQAQAVDANKFTSALHETLADKDLAVVRSVVPSPELAEAIIRWNVAQMGPETIDQGIDYMKTFVKSWADNVRTHQKQDVGRAEAVRARAVIESPVGSPPAPVSAAKPETFFKKDGGLDWSALHARALAGLEG